jgi:hypothetical protein
MKTRIIGALILSALTLSATACDTPEEIEQGIRQVEEVLGIDIPEDQEAKIITDRLALLEAQRQANALAPEHDYLDLETPAKVISIVAMSPEFNLDQAWVDRYVPWMMKIVLRESAGCYNLRRGGAFATASGAGVCAEVSRLRHGLRLRTGAHGGPPQVVVLRASAVHSGRCDGDPVELRRGLHRPRAAFGAVWVVLHRPAPAWSHLPLLAWLTSIGVESLLDDSPDRCCIAVLVRGSNVRHL